MAINSRLGRDMSWLGKTSPDYRVEKLKKEGIVPTARMTKEEAEETAKKLSEKEGTNYEFRVKRMNPNV